MDFSDTGARSVKPLRPVTEMAPPELIMVRLDGPEGAMKETESNELPRTF